MRPKNLFPALLLATSAGCSAAHGDASPSSSGSAVASSSSSGGVVADTTSGGDDASTTTATIGPEAAADLTFYKDVVPIVQKSCQGCHVTGGIAPFPLVTYADVRGYAADIVVQTSQGNMPPWGAVATPDCTPRFGWQNDPSLSSAEIATLAAWHAAGDAEGNPADAPPPPSTVSSVLQNPSLSLKPAAPFTITSGTADQFRCFVLDPKLTATQYVNGSFFVPGNATIVHHALVFTDPNGDSTKLVTDPATQSYDCFGGPNVSGTALLAAWAPGGVPVDFPPGSGAPLAAGTKLVMQVHYHPHSATAMLGPDQTAFQMRFASSTPEHLAATYLIGNFDTPVSDGTGLLPGPDDPASGPAFVIPPGVTDHTETMQFTLPALTGTVHLAAIAGHEHYVGTAVQITIDRAAPQPDQPASECLLSIPRWDFDWQREYSYDVPLDQAPTAAPGDVVKIKCTYNNTLMNPKVVQSLLDQGLSAPQTVRLGETTLDEMCLGGFLVTY